MAADNASLIERFLKYLQMERRLAPKTITSYEFDLQNFAQWSARPFADSGRTDVQRYLSELLGMGRSGTTVARHLASLRQIYRFLLDEELAQADPTRHMPIPKTWKKVPPSLSTAEVETMVASLGPSLAEPAGRLRSAPLWRNLRDKAMLLTFFSSGLRAGELAVLKVVDLDLESGSAKVWNGKGGKDGIVPLSPPAIAALKAYFDVRAKRRAKLRGPDSPYVFPGRAGRGIQRAQVYNVIRNIGRTALERRISPHALRRGFATAMIEGGADIRDVQALMRHASIDTTALYIRIDLNYLRRIYYASHPRARFARA
jgi:integrase/recombinase XerD